MNFFNNLVQKFTTLYETIWLHASWGKRGFFLSTIFIFLGFLGFLIVHGQKEEYHYLFTNLTKEDISAIVNFLEKNSYNSYIIDKDGVKVPLTEVDTLRVQLSQEGLPFSGIVGWEKFDERDFTKTEFEQEITKLRAIQGELSRTIRSIKGIESARVHIVMPKDSLFVREKKEPTAAIHIHTQRGVYLDSKQIRGIQHLVSRSVESLKAQNVMILDSQGQMLTEVVSEDPATLQSKELLVYKSSIEKSLEERVIGIVGKIVGVERVAAKVDADVDFTQEIQKISDVDPENSAVVSKNTTGFSMEGQGLNPTGIPGSKSNVPGELDGTGAGMASKSGSRRDSELINYEFSKKFSEKRLPVGKINRLTISAIVDGSQIYPQDGTAPEFIPRTEKEMKQIKELIKNAVGFKEDRDSLSVENMMFQLDASQRMEINTQRTEDIQYWSTLALSALMALALLLFFGFVARPYFRWLSYDPEKKVAQSIIEEYKPDLELGSMQNVHVQEEVPFEKMSPKEQVLYLAKNDPKRTTEAIRIMLSPTGGGG